MVDKCWQYHDSDPQEGSCPSIEWMDSWFKASFCCAHGKETIRNWTKISPTQYEKIMKISSLKNGTKISPNQYEKIMKMFYFLINKMRNYEDF